MPAFEEGITILYFSSAIKTHAFGNKLARAIHRKH